MDMFIKAIVLWPKKEEKPPRIIDLKDGRINVITGQSQAGKSALITIVDYALGSDKCAIPTGKIRDKTEWFGVVLQFKKNQLLLARREPGAQAQTGDMYMVESATIDLSRRPTKNYSRD